MNNRPGLKRPAPGVEAIQRAGDKALQKNPELSKTQIAKAYERAFGKAGTAEEPGTQGKVTGILNNKKITDPGKIYDRIKGCTPINPDCN